jgi:hypothetical protein
VKTFLVRLFVPADPALPSDGVRLHGVVEEIGNGRRAHFAGDRELVAFLQEVERLHATTPSERSTR